MRGEAWISRMPRAVTRRPGRASALGVTPPSRRPAARRLRPAGKPRTVTGRAGKARMRGEDQDLLFAGKAPRRACWAWWRCARASSLQRQRTGISRPVVDQTRAVPPGRAPKGDSRGLPGGSQEPSRGPHAGLTGGSQEGSTVATAKTDDDPANAHPGMNRAQEQVAAMTVGALPWRPASPSRESSTSRSPSSRRRRRARKVAIPGDPNP